MADFELAVPGVIYIGSSTGREKEEAPEGTPPLHVVHLGASAGWMKPRGIRQWTREVSVIRRSAFGEGLRKDLGATLPQEQVAPARMPLTSRASRESPFIAVSRNLVEKLVEKGVRVHTIGFDKITGGFYYLAEGGQSPAVRIEGDLIEMVSPALEAAGDGADLDSLLEGVIDRILLDVSKGDISEGAVELAAALPRLCTDGRGTQDCDLESFEREAAALVGSSAQFETLARVLASRLSSTKHSDVVTVPLFGEARREKESVITVNFGSTHTQLSARERWLVAGAPNREITLAPQRANTVRIPTSGSAGPASQPSADQAGPPPSGNGGGRVIPTRAPTPRPVPAVPAPTASPAPAAASASPVAAASPAAGSVSPVARPRPTPGLAPLGRPILPRPSLEKKAPVVEAAPVTPPVEEVPPPPAFEPPPPFEAPELLTVPESIPPDDLEERISIPAAADSLPVTHEDPTSEDALTPAAPPVLQTPPAQPLFAAPPQPVVREAPESPIFAPAAPRSGRYEVEPEPMTQPSQRRRREMEEAQARAVQDARKLALWLVIGVILILVAVYVIWSMRS
ncbi:hypothetical protein LZC95_43830 [Pendulispora brunnea]|uniref:Uncharacterized protein n=1 Tax=Pendulispora brunnea TaxID=2905690 RepID=A0ABZ2K3V8_9BACT